MMTTPRLILMYGAWLLAAGSIAVTAAVIILEVLILVGVIDRSGDAYGLWLGLLTAGLFVVLAAVPFAFRGRFSVESGKTPIQ